MWLFCARKVSSVRRSHLKRERWSERVTERAANVRSGVAAEPQSGSQLVSQSVGQCVVRGFELKSWKKAPTQ